MEYRLTCINNSDMHGNFVLYQRPERSEGSAHIRSLAWQSRATAPGTRVTFCWQTSTAFIWGEHGEYGGSPRFITSQEIEADIDRDNLVDLRAGPFGAPAFSNLRATPSSDGLTIRQLNARFDYPIFHGIARDSAPLLIAPFHMNVSTTFVVDPVTYWVHFNDCRAGELLDQAQLDGSQRLEFTASRPAQTVSMGTDNIIRPVAEASWIRSRPGN
ncbi:hypothetical protein [Rhizobium sp. SL86]|uniref:hypothetical protein n=1 Tax=Rhizobium sp. SL86 TaxID=2995148 RepID=UPI002273AE6E|nr:hypothetical protein [Rhizobium sp. SL86]MCY1669176.1 hypothetical protein [Rhizobium sp. SL86]